MNALKELRTAKGWTQKKLADVSGVNLRMVQKYEQGERDIRKASILTVVKLSVALGCKVDDLVN